MTKTKQELENRVAELEAQLRQQMKPSVFRNLLDWVKPYIIPFVLGMIVGVCACYAVFPNTAEVNLTQQERELVLSAIGIVETDIANGALQKAEAIDALMPLVPTPAKPLVQNSASLEDVKKKMRR